MPQRIAELVRQAAAANEGETKAAAGTSESSKSSDTAKESDSSSPASGPSSPPTSFSNLRFTDSPVPSHRVSQYKGSPDTPASRTGPPRTVSFVYSNSNSPSMSRKNSKFEADDMQNDQSEGNEFPFNSKDSMFRDAFEGGLPPSLRRAGKSRDSRAAEDSWNPMKWFQERSSTVGPPPDGSRLQVGTALEPSHGPQSAHPVDDDLQRQKTADEMGLRRSYSMPHKKDGSSSKIGRMKWSRLRSLVPNIVQNAGQPINEHSQVTSHAVNITDELITGGLSTLMLRLWFERDEKDQRRIPVLLHRLRIRVSDSLHPMQGNRAVFRIECEYANGAARWVVYRELRDFLSLHTHYAVSNAYYRNLGDLPEFPKTSN
jgi:phospholipase D1/2